MTASDEPTIQADVLARLLLVQSTAGHLPDESAVVSFVCRGLEMVPGVAKAWLSHDPVSEPEPSDSLERFPVRFGGTDYGDVVIKLTEPSVFRPYAPHVQNLLFIVAVMLEERRQRQLADAYQRELEMRVEQRTVQLTEEVAERRAAEAKALAEMRRAADYLEIAEAIIVELDAQGKIRVINKRGCDLLGYTADELIGQDWFDWVLPVSERTTVREVFLQVMAGRGKFVEYYDSPIVTRSGDVLHIAWHILPRLNDAGVTGSLSSGVDITQRKRAEDALAAEKERLAVTLRSIGDGVITTDTSGRILVMNPVAEELTGWTQLDAQGRQLCDVFVIVNEHTQESRESPVSKVLATSAVVQMSNHTQLIARNGTRRAISDSGAPIRDDQGNTIGVVLVFRDVTEKQRLMEQMQRAERLDAIGVLAGGIAHDFNNLLGGIFGYICLARDEALHRGVPVEALDEALKVFERARELTQQLLTFAKGGKPVCSVVDLRKLVSDCTRFALSGSNVSCQMRLSPDLPEVEADANQIWRAIDNLVRNAVQAMPHGGVITVHGEVSDVQDEQHPALAIGQYAKITIADNGLGIPKEILPRIFDPFFTTKERGSGLGLATAYSVVKKHDGHIEVQSELGAGSCFLIYLPAARRRLTAVTGSRSTEEHQGKGRALVMDDEPYLRSLFEKYLVRMGYGVTAVRDGNEAIAAAQAAATNGEPFEVALVDLTIPGGMGGKEAISRIREHCPGVIAIAASGYSDDPIMSQPEAFGFSASLGKPFAIGELAALLETYHGAQNLESGFAGASTRVNPNPSPNCRNE